MRGTVKALSRISGVAVGEEIERSPSKVKTKPDHTIGNCTTDGVMVCGVLSC